MPLMRPVRHMTRVGPWLATVLLLAACTRSTEETTTTASAPTSSLATTTTTIDSLLDEALPVDPDIRKGQLENGLVYYLRENDSPGGRAEFRLLVDVGSVQEDPDQAGMAHFLEHMMFNGTERFPRNDLIAVLESFGPRFGPDINAHTSFDETVYELSLSVDEELLTLGMDVLREWASRATLTETDVVEERGIVLDEWRLRAQGFGARVFDGLQELILADSPYAGHLPIGTDQSISSATPEVLERFYRDWYHPQRMAVIAVGDFDVDIMEQRIVDTFSDLSGSSESRAWTPPIYEPPDEASAGSIVDQEAASASVSVIWPVRAGPAVTVLDYQNKIALDLALGILSDRLNADVLEPNSPLQGASATDIDWARSLGIRGVDVEVSPSAVSAGLEKTLIEIERLDQFGVTAAETERAIAGFTALSNQLHNQQDSQQDVTIAAHIESHHLAGAHLMSPDQRFEVESGIAQRLTRQDLNKAIGGLLSGSPVIFVVGPDDAGLEIPDEEDILATLSAVSEMTLERRQSPDDEGVELMARPNPASIVEEDVDPRFEFTTLTYENGATVYLWESDIATEAVFGLIEGFGGTSVIDVDSITEANLMVDMVVRSGVGPFDAPSLRRLLADQLVSIRPYVGETRQGLEVNAAVSDAETMFQLVHLYMTQSRIDAQIAESVLDEIETVVASKDDLPDLLFTEIVNLGYYGDDPRYAVLPTFEQLDDFDTDLALSLFADRYDNAADFSFAFVGDFDTNEMTDLASRYIGTLPGTGISSGYVDNQPLPPREVQVTTLEAGVGQQGQLGMFFTNEYEADLKDHLTARLTELILNARLRDRIREELGTTYSIGSTIDLQRDPDSFIEASITSTGDPNGLEVISEEILSDMADLRANGPSETEFATGVEQLRNELELIDNRILAVGLVTAHLYPDEPVANLADRYPLIDELSAADVRNMVGAAFQPGQRIEVRQVPLR